MMGGMNGTGYGGQGYGNQGYGNQGYGNQGMTGYPQMQNGSQPLQVGIAAAPQ